MSDSPYKPPEAASYAPQATVNEGMREHLRDVARYQRWVMFALLANIAANIAVFALGGLPWPVQVGVLVVALGVVGFAIASVFLLTNEISGVGLAVLCSILMFVPCVSLITLLIINQKATSLLQSNGVKVGFLGVDPNSI